MDLFELMISDVDEHPVLLMVAFPVTLTLQKHSLRARTAILGSSMHHCMNHVDGTFHYNDATGYFV